MNKYKSKSLKTDDLIEIEQLYELMNDIPYRKYSSMKIEKPNHKIPGPWNKNRLFWELFLLFPKLLNKIKVNSSRHRKFSSKRRVSIKKSISRSKSRK